MRKATQLWEMYRDSGQAQDIMETALGAVVAAGGQALLTDMSAEEIALSTGLGAAGALAMRPAMARGGFALGRQLDKKLPDGLVDDMAREQMTASMLVGTPVNLKYWESQPASEFKNTMQALSQAKYNQNYLRKDGSERGLAEGFVGSMGRAYGDNLAQGAVALTTPFLLDSIGKESFDDQKVRQLKAELAKLERQG
tara:strand:+ start:261 stop:851 length:591 start_codon:yes stop_codon:yes gene_type:complete